MPREVAPREQLAEVDDAHGIDAPAYGVVHCGRVSVGTGPVADIGARAPLEPPACCAPPTSSTTTKSASRACSGLEPAELLTHLARNADGRRMVEAAARNEVAPMYPGGPDQRAADIAAGGGRPGPCSPISGIRSTR